MIKIPLKLRKYLKLTENTKSKGVPVEAIGVSVSELHEIWQVEGKQRSDLNLYHEHHHNLGEFLH